MAVPAKPSPNSSDSLPDAVTEPTPPEVMAGSNLTHYPLIIDITDLPYWRKRDEADRLLAAYPTSTNAVIVSDNW